MNKNTIQNSIKKGELDILNQWQSKRLTKGYYIALVLSVLEDTVYYEKVLWKGTTLQSTENNEIPKNNVKPIENRAHRQGIRPHD